MPAVRGWNGTGRQAIAHAHDLLQTSHLFFRHQQRCGCPCFRPFVPRRHDGRDNLPYPRQNGNRASRLLHEPLIIWSVAQHDGCNLVITVNAFSSYFSLENPTQNCHVTHQQDGRPRIHGIQIDGRYTGEGSCIQNESSPSQPCFQQSTHALIGA